MNLRLLTLMQCILQFTISTSHSHETALVKATTEVILSVCKPLKIPSNILITKRIKESSSAMDFLSDLLHSISIASNCAVHIRHANDLKTSHPLAFTIFLIDSMENFYEYYDCMNSATFNFRRFFLLVLLPSVPTEAKNKNTVVMKKENEKEKEMEEEYNFEMMMRSMWKINIYNVNIIYAEHPKEEASVLTFFPFQKYNCVNTQPVRINTFQYGKFMNEDGNFYPDKMNNLNNCSIKVATSMDAAPCVESRTLNGQTYPVGSDISVLNALSEALHFHIDYTFTKTQGYLDNDGGADGPFKLLLERNVDLGFDCYWLTRTRLNYLDSTTAYYNDYAIIVIPPGKELSPFEKLQYPFSWTVWILLVICCTTGLIVICILKHKPKYIQDFVFGSNVHFPDVNLLGGLLGATQTVLPKTNFARFLLINYLFFALNIRTFYQALMFHMMQTDNRHAVIQTIDEIKAKDLNLFVLKTSSELFYHNENIKSRIVNVTSREREDYINQIIDNPSFKGTVIMPKYKTLHRNYLNRGMTQMTICKEHLMSLSVVFYTPKNFYLNEKLDEKISLFTSAGLIKYWHIYDTKLYEEEKNDGPKVLTLHHLFGSFQILILGIAVSCITFIVERAWKYVK